MIKPQRWSESLPKEREAVFVAQPEVGHGDIGDHHQPEARIAPLPRQLRHVLEVHAECARQQLQRQHLWEVINV